MAAWIDIVRETAGWAVLDTGRLRNLVEEMSHPKTQYPVLLYFGGNGSRIKALQNIFPRNNITRRGSASMARLHLSTETSNIQHPVLFAESSLWNDSSIGKSPCRWPTEKLQRYPLQYHPDQSVADIQQQVLSNILLPMTQVLCLFVDTPSEWQKAKNLLGYRRRQASLGSKPIRIPIRVIIVITSGREMEFVHKENLQSISDASQIEIEVLDLHDRHMLSPKTAFEPLKRLLSSRMEQSAIEKIQQGLSFSADHLCVIWSRSIQLSTSHSGDSVLDYLQIARENHRANVVSSYHLEDLVCNLIRSNCSAYELHECIASALLMNAYPPEMHSMFA